MLVCLANWYQYAIFGHAVLIFATAATLNLKIFIFTILLLSLDMNDIYVNELVDILDIWVLVNEQSKLPPYEIKFELSPFK